MGESASKSGEIDLVVQVDSRQSEWIRVTRLFDRPAAAAADVETEVVDIDAARGQRVRLRSGVSAERKGGGRVRRARDGARQQEARRGWNTE